MTADTVLVGRGHAVTLFAHADSDVPCRHVPYGGTAAQSVVGTLRNTLTVSRLAFARPDVIHSFGRLAYLTPLLPLRLPKLMSYQRGPTPSRIRTAMALARKGSLLFTGCSDHIADEIRPYAPARTVYNGVPLDTYDVQLSVADDAPLVFLGRIAPIKGTHTAVEVARRSGRRLVIAGNVPDEQQAFFREEIEPHLDGEQIRCFGQVDNEEKNDLLGVTDGDTEFVCDGTEEMVEAVVRLGTLSWQACGQRFEDQFSARAIVDGYEQFYVRHATGEWRAS